MFLSTDTSQQSHFSRVPSISKPRSSFPLAERHITTMPFDKLIPIWHKYIQAGDTISIQHALVARLETQIAILYDDLYFDMHAWTVPMRLLQTDYARLRYNTQETPAQDNSALTTPSLPTGIDGTGVTGLASKSLYDYFGFPTLIRNTAGIHHVNTYLPRAYNKIWNTNYRDENLQTPVIENMDNGTDAVSDYNLLYRGKRHDRFTSMLTSLQKGTASSLPLGVSAPILRTPNAAAWTYYEAGVNTGVANGSAAFNASLLESAGVEVSADPNGGLYTDLSSATAASINDLRRSIAVQHILEADSRGGTRDIEAVLNRFGVTIPDFRAMRPEYLGGMTFSFDGKVVPQTSESGTTPQGTLTQFSQTQNVMGITHSFVEDSVMMILISARSNITYQQGLARELSYQTRFDFYQPEFANLGEVAVLQQELFYNGTADDNTIVAGYQEYGYEMRYGLNRVSAEMRSNYPTSRDYKHMDVLERIQASLSTGAVA